MNFNKSEKNNTKTTSYEGGTVYKNNLEQDWLNMLFSVNFEDRFYQSGKQQLERFTSLTEKMANKFGNEFIAKASAFTRNEVGNRSASQYMAAWLNDKQFENKRAYYKNFCHRVDDVAEVFAAIDSFNGKRSHAIVRGFSDYLETLDAYQIEKYKMNGKSYNLHDCINICHPESYVISEFQAYGSVAEDAGTTWEREISSSIDKAASWKSLVENKNLGYIALLRNLRNILDNINDNDWIEEYLCPQINNEIAIKKSLVYPYQIYSSWKALYIAGYTNIDVMYALEKAFRLSVNNMPNLNGKNLIMLDVSGSMESHISGNSDITIKECGAVYAAAILLANGDSDIIKFGTNSKYFSFNKNKNIFDTIRNIFANENLGYGTNLSSAFSLVDEHYDRIFIISDMQTMQANGYNTYADYAKKYGSSYVYSFDLGNYGTSAVNTNRNEVNMLTSLSSKTFDFIKIIEMGGSIVDYINKNYSYE